MKYYFLKPELLSDTGKTTISNVEPDQNYNSDKSIYAFNKIEFPVIEEVEFLILDNSSEFYDVLCAEMLMMSGLLVNKRTVEILKNFRLPTYKIYPFDVKNRKDIVNTYYWIQMSKNRNIDFAINVDYTDSIFLIRKRSREIQPIIISNCEEYYKIQSKLSKHEYILTNKIKIKFDENEWLDIFKVPSIFPYWIVSERLKNSLKSNDISGIVIQETDAVKG